MFLECQRACVQGNVRHFGLACFYEEVGSLTAGDSKRKSAVDYVVQSLANESIEEI